MPSLMELLSLEPQAEASSLAKAIAGLVSNSKTPRAQDKLQGTSFGQDELLRHHYMNIVEGKAVENDDGSLSTVYSRQVNHPDLNDGKPTLIPSVWNGKILNEREAIKKAIASGRDWTWLDTHPELRELDIKLHEEMSPHTTKKEAQEIMLNWAKPK